MFSAIETKLVWHLEPAAFDAIEAAKTLEDYRIALARVEISTYGIAANGDAILEGAHPIYWPIRAKEDRLDRLRLMLDAGASIEGRPGNGEALHIFAGEKRGDSKEQKEMAHMLVQAGAEIDAIQYDGKTPLAIAVSGGGYAETAALLDMGASTSIQVEWKTLQSTIFIAPLVFVAAHHSRIFQLILNQGVNTKDCDSNGRTLAVYLQEARAEYARLATHDNMSGNLMRHVKRNLRALEKSLEILELA